MSNNTENLYNEGQLVEVEVVKVKDYGALTVTTDNKETRGLVHKSEIANTYINSPHNYFEEGDILKTRIVDWDEKEKQMSLSTKEFNLEKAQNNKNYNKLAQLKQQLKSKEEQELDSKEPNKKELEKIYKDKEFNKIIKFLNGKIGVISPQAKKELAKTILKYGIFNFSMSLSETLPDFKVDYGVILANRLKEDLKNNNLVKYIVTDHAVHKYKKRSKKYLDKTIDKNKEDIENIIEKKCYRGEVIIETDEYKYIKHGNWFLPCSKKDDADIESWYVKSILTWDMFKNNMQEKVEKYF